MHWLLIVPTLFSLAALGEVKKLKDKHMAHITDVEEALADLRTYIEKQIEDVRASTAAASAASATAAATATWASALDGIVTEVATIKAAIPAVRPPAASDK